MKSSEGNRLNAATQNKTKKRDCLKLESFPCVNVFAYLGLFAEAFQYMCTNSIGAGVELSSNQVFESLWICMLLQVTAAKVDLTVPGGGGGL